MSRRGFAATLARHLLTLATRIPKVAWAWGRERLGYRPRKEST